jgi:hypothetical protein
MGDSKSVKIWGDKWIDSTCTGKIQAPVQILGENDKASALIDDMTQWWNYELIQEIFPEDEAKQIYNTIISPLGKTDQIVWAGTQKGIFTVCSAYHRGDSCSLFSFGF